MSDDRIERERQHWDEHSPSDLYADWVEESYVEWRSTRMVRHATDFLGPLKGKRILVCSEGKEVVPFAREGAEVWCFDISAVRIRALQALVDRCGVSDRVHLAVMPFEKLEYPDHFFDLAFGIAVVHHVDLEQAGSELARVLKPGGHGSFLEPLGTNPLVEFIRRRVPYRHKGRTEDETPFTYESIRAFGRPFAVVDVREFALFSALYWRVITNRRIGDMLSLIDGVLLRYVRWLRPLCSQVSIGVEKAAAPASTPR